MSSWGHKDPTHGELEGLDPSREAHQEENNGERLPAPRTSQVLTGPHGPQAEFWVHCPQQSLAKQPWTPAAAKCKHGKSHWAFWSGWNMAL